MTKFIVGVDVGGTFTDLVWMNTLTGEFKSIKVPSTPPRYIDGIINAFNESKIKIKELKLLKHGATNVYNTVTQRKGSQTALITTSGFRDILEVARGERPDHFNFLWDAGPPLVSRRNRFGVLERVDHEGKIIKEIDIEQLLQVVEAIKKRDIQSVAICFLNSYINPIHEKIAKKIVERKLPNVYVTASYEISCEIKEFERTSSTTVNAYLGPTFDRYFEELNSRLANKGYTNGILFAHSNCGVMTSDRAREVPAKTILSGSASGVIGGLYTGNIAKHQNIITLDIGGTSAELGLIFEGEPLVKNVTKIEFNIPVLFPSIDIVSLGVGGNSIAWLDTIGTLKCGPQNTEIYPGPACYGLGGVEPTITDANLVLGRISPEGLFGGEIKLKAELARRVIQKKIANPLKIDLERAAEGIVEIANCNIANAIRLLCSERGKEPSEFVLIVFGGAGPLHAAEIASRLNISKVIIPPTAGAMSAFGLLTAKKKYDSNRPVMKKVEEVEASVLQRICNELEKETLTALKNEGVAEEKIELKYFLETKYQPKSQYVTLPLKSNFLKTDSISLIIEEHHKQHKLQFGYDLPHEYIPVEIINLRVVGQDNSDLQVPQVNFAEKKIKTYNRPSFFREIDSTVLATVLERKELKPGFRLQGPVIIEDYDATTVVPPNVQVEVDNNFNLIINLKVKEKAKAVKTGQKGGIEIRRRKEG